MYPNTPSATHLGQNDAPERPCARHFNQNDAPNVPVPDILTKMMCPPPPPPVLDILATMMCPDAPVRDIPTKLIDEETFIFKNERFTMAEARFLKPVRARTGSEFLRERMLSLGMNGELGREGEHTRRKVK